MSGNGIPHRAQSLSACPTLLSVASQILKKIGKEKNHTAFNKFWMDHIQIWHPCLLPISNSGEIPYSLGSKQV